MDGKPAGRAYACPTIRDYGDLVQLTGDVGMLHVGIGGPMIAQISGAASPAGGLACATAGDGTDPATADSGDSPGSVGGTLGTTGSGGGSGGGGSGGGGGGGHLPFTGLALGAIAAAGSGLSAAGVALRRRLRR
jgi:hypothetical protein